MRFRWSFIAKWVFGARQGSGSYTIGCHRQIKRMRLPMRMRILLLSLSSILDPVVVDTTLILLLVMIPVLILTRDFLGTLSRKRPHILFLVLLLFLVVVVALADLVLDCVDV